MKITCALLLLLFLAPALPARVLEVGPGAPYGNLEPAAAEARPGDTILFRKGTYPGGSFVNGLQGTPDAWITIMAQPDAEVLLQGGSNAWQLSDPAYLRITGFTLEGQTGNGLNIDDGGTFDTPAHHIIIERCTWRGINATGNNDMLKLSGIDSFRVSDCTFQAGSPGGSMIDMVGCHNGEFTGNHFVRAGSNCIQAKGGTRYIRIERNSFIDGGARAINIGGSTGLEFFRPQGALYESADIGIYSNIFFGAETPVAFVGTVRSEVVNNTIYAPGRWALRILQETTEPGFLECGDNIFRNNIVVASDETASPGINIGPNTRPESFLFSNNLWYNSGDPGWEGPALPSPESGRITGRDPILDSPVSARLGASSPAIMAGYPAERPTLDYHGVPFAPVRSIGAVEGLAPAASAERQNAPAPAFRLLSGTGSEPLLALLALPSAGRVEMKLYDLRGEEVWSGQEMREAGESRMMIPLNGLPAGAYLCVMRYGGTSLATLVAVRR